MCIRSCFISRPTPTHWLLGIDTGGTFTDFVLYDGRQMRTCKVLSTPGAPEQAIRTGIRILGLEERLQQGALHIVHGTTIATNAALQGQGARTALITNRGLTDLLTIGRQARQELYQLAVPALRPPVPAAWCFAADCRLDADGNTLQELTAEDLARLATAVSAADVQAVAINLLFSFHNAAHEERIAQALPAHLFVSRSSEVLPRNGEYERGIATWLNARLGPLVQGYLARMHSYCAPSPVAIMQSDGLTVDAETAPRRAARLLLSGPAGGVAAARLLAQCSGHDRLLTFDMGGTSTDVAAVQDACQLTHEGRIGDWPLAVPMLDIHTIGAGGGSLAHVDAGGILHVGPASAGADPGPACYGQGGKQATVTDANLVLGRLPADQPLGGELRLDRSAALRALEDIGRQLGTSATEAAAGIINLANDHMAAALRQVSVARGLDPASFALCCFGGAGGLHVCELADLLRIRTILIPPHAGIFSALGMLAAAPGRSRTLTREWNLDAVSDESVNTLYAQLEKDACQELYATGVTADQVRTQRTGELRYLGQSFTLSLPWTSRDEVRRDFHQLHQQTYGHSFPGQAVELVHLGVQVETDASLTEFPDSAGDDTAVTPTARVRIAGIAHPVPVYPRGSLQAGVSLAGPLLVTEPTTTALIAEHWNLRMISTGTLLLERNC